MKKRQVLWSVLAAGAFILGPLGAVADEIEDAIKEATAAYKKGDLNEASKMLDYASQLIRQKRGGDLKAKVFPEPLPGWTAGDAESDASGAAILGGMAGVNLSREYKKEDKKVRIEVHADSPIVRSMAGMLKNPALIAAGGGKVTRINGNMAMIKDGDLQMMAGDNAFINVDGTKATEDEVIAYAKGINTDALKKKR